MSNARLVVFLAGLALAWLIFGPASWPLAGLAVPALVFFGLVVFHDRVIQRRRRVERSISFYEQGLARLDDRWQGSGEGGAHFLDPAHPYATDLDLFGDASLFQLLCTAQTQGGEEMLADWLREPAPVAVIRERQEAAAELKGRLDLREELAMLGSDARGRLHPRRLREWGGRPPLPGLERLRAVSFVISLLPPAAAVLGFSTGIGFFPFTGALVLALSFRLFVQRQAEKLLGASERSVRDLALFSSLLARFERERFGAKRLATLRAKLDVGGLPPSESVAALMRLENLLDARRHQFFAPIALVLLWEIQFALAIEVWRVRHGPHLGDWIDAISELEALVDIGGYSFEHPDDPFPELVEEGPLFDGEQIGHPLLPAASCVRNDVHLGREKQLLIVSGSNMSGKSTLLRTLGTSTVLAQAGAPVRARRLALSPLAVGASIRINDSLQEGTSRFYAEIKRIAQLIEMAGADRPLLFLLDEVLHGTNSHDRRIGAEAVATGLVERGAVGLVTTHDLSLAKIAETLAPRAENVHFEDHLEDGRIRFDYKMRPGVVEKSNALELMRTVGIRV